MLEPADSNSPLHRITLQAMSLLTSNGRWLNRIMTVNERMFLTENPKQLELLSTAAKKVWDKRPPGIGLAPLPTQPEMLSIKIPKHNTVEYSNLHSLLCMYVNTDLAVGGDKKTQERMVALLEGAHKAGNDPRGKTKAAFWKSHFWVDGDNKEDFQLPLHPVFLSAITPKIEPVKLVEIPYKAPPVQELF